MQPLHWLEVRVHVGYATDYRLTCQQEWHPNQECFRRTSLKRLGQVVQLGHRPHETCLQPIAAHSDFTVIHTNGIHLVNVQFCGCGKGPRHTRQQLMRNGWWPASVKNPQTCATIACLRLFHKLNACSKISIHEFYRAVERLTDNTGTQHITEKRRVFGDMVNQFRHTTMLKRFGIGHTDAGVDATPPGALAMRCRACPQPGRNLPPDWKMVSPEKRFLYQKFVAQDANFRLANAMRPSEARSSPLGDGWAYFVPRAPYMQYVTSFASEEDISSCSGFAAVFLANLKRVRGLRATGIAAAICSRHNMFLPNGIGDLQKGERFCNMTYILASALAHERVDHIVYSYDVACVFDKNLMQRVATLPAEVQARIAQLVIQYFVPNFHLPAHRSACHAMYSFHFARGVGRTHGETVEENWFLMNKAAMQTKPMGPATRQLTLDDLAGCHDHEMDVSLGKLRLTRTVQSYMSSFTEFDQLRDGLQERDPALVEEWINAEKRWQETRSGDCPYEFSIPVQKVRDVELALQEQELQRTADGTAVVQEVTVTAFIKLGLDVQHAQRLLLIEVKAIAQPTSTQQLAIIKKRSSLRKSVEKLRAWQRIYMPSLRQHLTNEELAIYDKVIDDVENMRLFMPSELSTSVREAVCAPGVAATETAFRKAEAEECLEDLRRALHVRTTTDQFRQANMRFIGAATRARAAFDKIAKRVHILKIRYRFARNCLVCLLGHGDWELRLRVLQDQDVRALNERAMTAEEEAERERRRALGETIDWTAEDGVILAGVVNAGEGTRRLSWIWYTDPGQAAVTEGHLNEALRVEFLKSKARRDRDREEIELLLEEMRRVQASLDHDAEEWEQRALARTGCDEFVLDGLRSYAKEQALVCRERAAIYDIKWKTVRHAATLALDLLFDDVVLTDDTAAQELEDVLDGVERDDEDLDQGGPSFTE
ncbi:hypothetical protein GGF50DRAFT_67861 [Schizophyllum commune]